MLRGYSLNLVMMLSTMLVVLLATMLAVLDRSALTSSELLSRKQTFFAADGTMRAIVKVSNDFLRANPSADGPTLKASFTVPILDSITPVGYTREDFDIDTTGRQNGTVPNGAFQGMQANLYPITAKVKLRKGLTLASARQDMSATLAQISMFQFMVFIDGFGDWVPGVAQNVNGRVHANGDLCLAADRDFCLGRVTASGRLLQAEDGNCPYNPPGAVGPPYIAKDATPDFTTCDGVDGVDPAEWGTLASTAPQREHGCVNCAGIGGAVWPSWARSEFNNNALDVDMAVPALKLPITGTPQAQAGNAADNTQSGNSGNSRFLVDPVRAADAADIRAQKYADKADIRIIDGVWYIHDLANPANWPGLAIWSDHPGNYTITNAISPDEFGIVGGVNAGQSQIKAALAGRGIVWPSTPRRFSYYEVDPAAAFVMLDTTAAAKGIVSYGTLFRNATAPVSWSPGHWPGDDGNNDLCPNGTNDNAGNAAFRSALVAAPAICSGGGGSITVDTALLNGTRSGFRDGHIEDFGGTYAGMTVTGSPDLHQKILPMNFDVAQFVAALGDNTVGELGSYFCANGGGCFMHRPFNGIVWIGVTWGGSLANFASGNKATIPPAQGSLLNGSIGAGQRAAARTDTNTAGGSDNAGAQIGLPYDLCSTSQATQPATPNADANKPIRFPNCTDFNGGGGARPNAVRLVNGGDVGVDYTFDGVIDGLSIVSNAPVYVLGEWNVRDNGGVAIDTTGPATTPWVPAMVGGDQVYMLSNAWSDSFEPWDQTTDKNRAVATGTTYNIEVLSGWSHSKATVYSGGIENFPRFIEKWGGGTDNVINGSLVVGFDSVYFRWPRSTNPYSAPRRRWAYDTHLDTISNQPPGTPEYNVYATRQWTRK